METAGTSTPTAARPRSRPAAANPFRPAGKIRKGLKVLLYGEAGSGKTWAALTFPGPVAVIDTEGSTELYGGRKDVQPFDVLRTKSFDEAMRALEFIERDNGATYKTLIVDPVTVLYQVLQEAVTRVPSMMTQDGGISYRGWDHIKRSVNTLYVRLANLPINVVVTSRLKDNYEAKGREIVRAGVRPDADKQTPYLFDIVLRLVNDESGRRALVEKDRSGVLAPVVADFSFKDLASIAERHSDGQESRQEPEGEAARRDAEAIERADHWTQQPLDKFYAWLGERGLSQADAEKALGCPIARYAGSKEDAIARINAYAGSAPLGGNGREPGAKPADTPPEAPAPEAAEKPAAEPAGAEKPAEETETVPERKAAEAAAPEDERQAEADTPGQSAAEKPDGSPEAHSDLPMTWLQAAERLNEEHGTKFTAGMLHGAVKKRLGIADANKSVPLSNGWEAAIEIAQEAAQKAKA